MDGTKINEAALEQLLPGNFSAVGRKDIADAIEEGIKVAMAQHEEAWHSPGLADLDPEPWVPKVGDAVITGTHFVYAVTWTDGERLSVSQDLGSWDSISNFRPWKP